MASILLSVCLCISLCFLALSSSPCLITTVLGQAASPSGTLFTVTTVAATSSNPNFGSNLAPSAGFVFAVDGIGANGPTSLILLRGGSYVFDSSTVSSIHPFYVGTDSVGQGAGMIPGGGPLSAPGQLTYIADPTGTGNVSLFFDCANHPHMGGNILVIPSNVPTPNVTTSSTGNGASSNLAHFALTKYDLIILAISLSTLVYMLSSL